MTDALLAPFALQLTRLSRRQPGCRALQAALRDRPVDLGSDLVGDGRRPPVLVILRRDPPPGLDITVYASDTKRATGRLARQGSSLLRWALYEAAMPAAARLPRPRLLPSPPPRLGAQRAALSVARKLARRCHHRLRALGDDAWTDAA